MRRPLRVYNHEGYSKNMTKLSVIIPTLNEAEYLPALLESLNKQTFVPYEIIVADAGSNDNTREIAQKYNARVIDGGTPGKGRNAGAKIAQGDIFLFLDADVLPPSNFIEYALNEFQRNNFAVATCLIEAISDDVRDSILIDAINLYMQIIMPISPRAPGFCIFVRRDVHFAINGFDETLKMSEDHDYVRRASKYGKFGILKDVKIPVSMRRLRKEGIVNLAIKYLWCEMHVLAGKPIRSLPFEYEFGTFGSIKPTKTKLLLDVEKIEDNLKEFENPILSMSNNDLEQFSILTNISYKRLFAQRINLLLEKRDNEILRQYLKRRLAMLARHKRLADSLYKARNRFKWWT
jgi:glycosyltransferase involved in cell wall biosynthesis